MNERARRRNWQGTAIGKCLRAPWKQCQEVLQKVKSQYDTKDTVLPTCPSVFHGQLDRKISGNSGAGTPARVCKRMLTDPLPASIGMPNSRSSGASPHSA